MRSIKQQNILTEGLLRYLTEEQLKKIQSVKVGIGGAGGLGSNVAIILVRTGFSHIEILDHDVIDASNLNRQQYYADEVGLPKTDVLEKRLLAINPELEIKSHQIKWDESNASSFFKGYDVIIEAFDNAEYKHRFVSYYNNKCRYMVSGVGMAGLLEKRPMSVKKIGNVYFCGDLSTDSSCGHPPMAPRVTMCASMMAEVVLDATLGIKAC